MDFGASGHCSKGGPTMTHRPLYACATLAFISTISLAFSGCGLGSDMDVGNDKSGQSEGSGGEAGDTGGSTGAGNATATGGAAASSGGVSSGSGGANTGGVEVRITGGGSPGTGNVPSAGGSASSGGSASAGGAPSTGVPCGKNTCSKGLYCCNASCGVCAPPGEACDMIACEDPGPTVPCGKNTCSNGLICCNASCGICTPKGGACLAIACDPDPVSECTTNADCRVVSDYCGGCNCRALAPGQKLPACSGAEVQCLIAPCDGKAAVCQSGKCVAQ
jgi:hypothetical protein